jgi:hypothetical protein
LKTYTDAKIQRKEIIDWKERLKVDEEPTKNALIEVYGEKVYNEIVEFEPVTPATIFDKIAMGVCYVISGLTPIQWLLATGGIALIIWVLYVMFSYSPGGMP